MLRKAADELQILRGTSNLLTVREAADLLRVRPCTIYRLVREGQLDALRVSHAIRIPAVALVALGGRGASRTPGEHNDGRDGLPAGTTQGS